MKYKWYQDVLFHSFRAQFVSYWIPGTVPNTAWGVSYLGSQGDTFNYFLKYVSSLPLVIRNVRETGMFVVGKTRVCGLLLALQMFFIWVVFSFAIRSSNCDMWNRMMTWKSCLSFEKLLLLMPQSVALSKWAVSGNVVLPLDMNMTSIECHKCIECHKALCVGFTYFQQTLNR